MFIESGMFAGLRKHAYRAISLDPPWSFSGGKKGRPQHYKRMTDEEIAGIALRNLAHPEGCHLFMWVTSPKMYCTPASSTRLNPDDIADAMGFRFSGRAFVWVKTINGRVVGEVPDADDLKTSQGFTTRKNAEDVLLFKSGSPKRIAKNIHEIIIAPAREHSRKPDEFYARVMRYCEGPYLEAFARESRPGWDTWGDEAKKFDGA